MLHATFDIVTSDAWCLRRPADRHLEY